MTIADLVQNVRRYDPSLDPAWLESVYAVAETAHREQRRASGESYIEHPLAVAAILADLEMDRQTIAAALLHGPRQVGLGKMLSQRAGHGHGMNHVADGAEANQEDAGGFFRYRHRAEL